jgi:hypothetical protein
MSKSYYLGLLPAFSVHSLPTGSNQIFADVSVSNQSIHQLLALDHISLLKELLIVCGGYRSRTDDPLLAKQVL